jgi:hypothetical protein
VERPLFHRVIRIETNSYFMKGENTGGADSPVPRANLLGMVTRVERGPKKVLTGLGPEGLWIALPCRKGWMTPFVRFAAGLRGSLRNLMKV